MSLKFLILVLFVYHGFKPSGWNVACKFSLLQRPYVARHRGVKTSSGKLWTWFRNNVRGDCIWTESIIYQTLNRIQEMGKVRGNCTWIRSIMYQANNWGIWMSQLTLPHSYENPAIEKKPLYMPFFCVLFCDCHP